ncbi:hypothetical protein [Lihuaxuella thermophila]|uniref:Uncharacterized protein n=1 Tax=Lihuaxuella thermophila TaxID=1173111 RepID=A0A1H8HAH1_9BACL|nr:hypothetical protein [Lihuaxuella thermophila]SEN53321.1 hypothetical protein SAMN05444955_113121 [Lihuaxuella thermophila]SEN78250.1 hypothetical protein SAMN05444955_12338 [Lihuaxuella thermophila]SEN80298.1 hypothetical protein SAMN05444955_1264 [Lihuaxuella thermophila]
MNRWWVYEFMKNRYLETGVIPQRREILAKFSGMETKEISEGMIEFHLAYPRFKEIRDDYEALKKEMGA